MLRLSFSYGLVTEKESYVDHGQKTMGTRFLANNCFQSPNVAAISFENRFPEDFPKLCKN